MAYNGYANYQTWNVCLWISNDEGFYSLAKECADYNEFRNRLKNDGMTLDCATMYETPDLVSWNDSAIEMQEMNNFWAENFSMELSLDN
jgi:hypothetical protein